MSVNTQTTGSSPVSDEVNPETGFHAQKVMSDEERMIIEKGTLLIEQIRQQVGAILDQKEFDNHGMMLSVLEGAIDQLQCYKASPLSEDFQTEIQKLIQGYEDMKSVIRQRVQSVKKPERVPGVGAPSIGPQARTIGAMKSNRGLGRKF